MKAVLKVAVLVLAVLMLGCTTCGCASNKKVDQLLAMTKAQAERQAYAEKVALELAKRGGTVMADTLANMEPGAAAGWSKAGRVVREPDGKVLMVDGQPVFETIEAVGKSRSGRDIAGVTKGSLTLAGLPRGKDGDIDTTAPFDGFRLEIEAASGNTGPNVEWLKAYMDGIANEKAVIVGGMANLAKERGAAYAVKVNALSKGVCEFITASGAVVGQLTKLSPVAAAAQLAEAGVTKIIEATIQKTDGEEAKVIVADTSQGQNATAVETSGVLTK